VARWSEKEKSKTRPLARGPFKSNREGGKGKKNEQESTGQRQRKRTTGKGTIQVTEKYFNSRGEKEEG